MWSSDSNYVLLRYRDGKYDSTAVYSLSDRRMINLGHVTDGFTAPIRWVSSRTFVVEHSGPHGGRMPRRSYHYRETYRIRSKPFDLDSVYTGRTVWEVNEPDS